MPAPYAPRKPEETVLYRVLQGHLATFLHTALQSDDRSLPRFVDKDHDRCTGVLRIFARAVLGFYRKRALARGVPSGHTGTVTFIQRFGSAANLNLHFHMIALDGVFTEAEGGELTFHRAEPSSDQEIAELLAAVRTRVRRHLARKGFLDEDRLCELPDGRIALELKTPWSDGSTQLLYEPLDLIAKLAALVPRPNKNLVLYHGVLSAHAALRARVVRYGRAVAASPETAAPSPPLDPGTRAKRLQWAELMRRAFGHDLLACLSCGGKMALIACILEHTVIRKILAHLGLPTDPPATARASPDPEPLFDDAA